MKVCAEPHSQSAAEASFSHASSAPKPQALPPLPSCWHEPARVAFTVPLLYTSPHSSFLLPPEFSICRFELLRVEDTEHGCTCAGHMLTLFLQSFPNRQRGSYFSVCYVHPVKFSKSSRQGLRLRCTDPMQITCCLPRGVAITQEFCVHGGGDRSGTPGN